MAICAIPSSLRTRSFNTSALRTAEEFAAEGVTIEEAVFADILIYHEHVKAAAFPSAIVRLSHAVACADTVRVVTAE